MLNLQQHKNTIADKGFSVISNVFSTEEIEKITVQGLISQGENQIP